MHDDEADREAGRLRAEAVAMLSEQAALCSAPAPVAPDPDRRSPAPAALAAPQPVLAPGGTDTAALLRELSSLGADPARTPSPAAAPAASGPARRSALFGRRPRSGR